MILEILKWTAIVVGSISVLVVIAVVSLIAFLNLTGWGPR